MLDVPILELAVKGVKVQERGNVCVRRRAVVAFVEVVGQDLPVVVSIQLVGVVQIVIVKVDLVVPRLHVDIVKVLLPGHLGSLLGVHVDPDEAVLVDFCVDAKQAILLLIKLTQSLVARGFGQVAVEAVRPSVVSKKQKTSGLDDIQPEL